MGPRVKHLWLPKVCRCLENTQMVGPGNSCQAGHKKDTRKMGNAVVKLRSRDRDEQPGLDWVSGI